MSNPRTNTAVLPLAGLALLALASPLRAQGPPPDAATAVGSHEAHAEEHVHANELGVFLGGTSEDDATHFTIGVEYERRLTERLGLGLVVEHVDGIDAWVFLAPLTLKPVRHLGLVLYAGPGFERKVPELEVEHVPTRGAEGGVENEDRETFFVFRTGAAWALELGRIGLHPQVELDFTRERDEWRTALVFGVAVGFGF